MSDDTPIPYWEDEGLDVDVAAVTFEQSLARHLSGWDYLNLNRSAPPTNKEQP